MKSQLQERTSYQPTDTRDKFIVAILNTAINKVILEWSNRRSESRRILDIGCGNQPFRKILEDLSFQYYSIDSRAQTHAVPDYIGSIDSKLPDDILNAETFQFVLCTEVLEHVFNWDIAFCNFSRLLADEGRLLITVPFVFPLHEEPSDYWRPTPHAIREYGLKYGLKIVSSAKLGSSREVLGQTILETLSHWSDWNPAESALSKLESRIYRKMLSLGLKIMLSLLSAERLAKLFPSVTSLYLSTVVEFIKVN